MRDGGDDMRSLPSCCSLLLILYNVNGIAVLAASRRDAENVLAGQTPDHLAFLEERRIAGSCSDA